MKAISVIIVTYNSEPDIYGCLDALLTHNDLGEALEIIVVDNASTSFERMHTEIQRLYGNRITVLSNTRNGGYGQGNNLGIAHATAPVIMIMNPDVRWESRALATIVNAYRNNERLALYGFQQLTMTGKRTNSFFFHNTANALERSIGTFLANKLNVYCGKKMCFSGACFCVRKSMIESIGGFDEQIFMYAEEHDIHYRLKERFPSSVNKYNRHLHYKHRIEQRDFSETAYRKRIESNMYVFSKQHKDPTLFVKTEDKTIRIVSCLKRIIGDNSNQDILNRQRWILKTYV